MTSGTISNWTEAILISVAFVAVFGLILTFMNADYSKNYNTGLTDNSSALSNFIAYQATADSAISDGEVAFDAQEGITLKESYSITKEVIKIIWRFISGGWIESIINLLNLGEMGSILGQTLRVLYFLSLVYGLLYALFKIAL